MRDYGVVRFRFTGDESLAKRYIAFARTQLGVLKQLMRAQSLRQLTRRLVLSDGAVITVSSIFGQDVIDIAVASLMEATAPAPSPVPGVSVSLANRLYVWGGTSTHAALQPCNFVIAAASDQGGNFTPVSDLLSIGANTSFAVVSPPGPTLATATPTLGQERFFGILDHLLLYDPHFAYEWLAYLLQHAKFVNAVEKPDTFLLSDPFTAQDGTTQQHVLIGTFLDYAQPSDVALVPLQYFAGYRLLYSEFKTACKFSAAKPADPNPVFIEVTYPDDAVRFDTDNTLYTRRAVGTFTAPTPANTGVPTPINASVSLLGPSLHSARVYQTILETYTDSSNNDLNIADVTDDTAYSYEIHTLGSDGLVKTSTLTFSAATGEGDASASSASLGTGDINFSGVTADLGLFLGSDIAAIGSVTLSGGTAPQGPAGGNYPATLDLTVTSSATLDLVGGPLGSGSSPYVDARGGWIGYLPSHNVLLTAYGAPSMTASRAATEAAVDCDLTAWLAGESPLAGVSTSSYSHFDFAGDSPNNIHAGSAVGFFMLGAANYGGVPAPGCVLWYRSGLTGALVFRANDATRMDDCQKYRNVFTGVDGYLPGQPSYEPLDQILARVVTKTTIVANNFAPDALLPWLDDTLQGAIL